MKHDPVLIRQNILAALPLGFVEPRHTEAGHFYQVNDQGYGCPVYPSVTGKLQPLKDEGIANWKMDKALEYIFAHYKEFTDANVMEHIAAAEKVPADIFHDAGDIGTDIHDVREKIFREWIESGKRPTDFLGFIEPEKHDIRIESAIRALSKFCDDYRYVPVVTELPVYSHKWKTAGTLDDIGLCSVLVRRGTIENCQHQQTALDGSLALYTVEDPEKNVERCMQCDAKWERRLTLLDLKTSNQFKYHYFFQVGIYYGMFRALTGITPDWSIILKVSKTDSTYKIEDLKRPKKIVQLAAAVMRVNDGIDFIKSLRKDNQRKVMKL